jgi:hypothetical protein
MDFTRPFRVWKWNTLEKGYFFYCNKKNKRFIKSICFERG